MSLSSVCVVTNALRLRYFKNSNNIIEKNKIDGTEVKTEKNNTEECLVKCKANIKNDSKLNNKKNEEVNSMKTILIEGMQCNHCKMTVEKALSSIEGITNVEVSLEDKNAVIEYNKEIENDKIKQVIEEAGFSIIEIK